MTGVYAVNPGPTGMSFGLPFDYMVNASTPLLFMTGDKTLWAVATYADIMQSSSVYFAPLIASVSQSLVVGYTFGTTTAMNLNTPAGLKIICGLRCNYFD